MAKAATKAVSPIIGNIEGAVTVPLDKIVMIDGFNKREKLVTDPVTKRTSQGSLRLDLMIPQIMARGRVVEPIKVYVKGPKVVVINGHRRVSSLHVIKDIKAGKLTAEQARAEYGITLDDFNNALHGSADFTTVPAIIVDEGTPLTRRLESLMANAGQALDPIEQAREFLELKGFTWKEALEAAKVKGYNWELPKERQPTDTLINADICRLTGYSKAHVSQRLAMVEAKKDDTPELKAAREYVAESVQQNKINSNEARDVLKAKPRDAGEAKALVEIMADKAAKASKGPATDSGRDTSGSVTRGMIHDILPAGAAKDEQDTLRDNKRDGELLLGILVRQGLSWVKGTSERWAATHKPSPLTVPWIDRPLAVKNVAPVAAPFDKHNSK